MIQKAWSDSASVQRVVCGLFITNPTLIGTLIGTLRNAEEHAEGKCET